VVNEERHEYLARTGVPITITKHGKPVAQLVPVPGQTESLFGYMKNTLTIKGDIVSAVREEWSALSGDEDGNASPRRRP
jgi:antitoxin (DNA-binding transcriptional repressor) of toxin-antitoxin stability system